MAVVTTNSKIVTGSTTKTLGTLGRSIFNSTIGTYYDKDTMNQIYGAIDKLTSSIETVDKTVDFEALNGRNKADDLFSLLAGLDIKSSSDFMNKNREFMKRLMRLNKQEKDITLEAIGVDVTGESDTVRNEYVRDYKHVQGNNYFEEYVKTLPKNQQIGDETTTLQLESSTNFNYAGLHNDLYVVNQNLYPDDENKGTFANKWIVENRNSILYKTKKLFNSNKVNTIISRFHTNPNKRPSLLDNAKSKYGLSHGRNLLTAKAERGLNSSYANGYDNPYCRVWTHHHQYDRYYKTIRPFSNVDDQGNYIDTMSVQDFHQWDQFSDSKDTNAKEDGGGGTKGKWGWKKEKNNGWQYSVLQDNGKVNITPKYVNGGSSNIHTKQCMFSIENLAWRGYDPYSFEQALSWEQRGPLGGRIMWFPPYGIHFNETTSTQWVNNTFLGRGEDVYTYANTTRTGTLSFMMVVDHPSILDYVTWTEENRNVTDTDILRFLAGCGEGDGGLRSKAKPTPLTDEYTQIHSESFAPEELIKESTEGKEENINPEDEKPLDDVLCFYVFYPNNYSGTYDDPKGELRNKYNNPTKVEPIPYLLAGTGAQKSSGEYTKGFENDIPINDADVSTWTGTGYEMTKNKGLGQNGTNYITGTYLYPNGKDKNGKRVCWKGLGNEDKQKPYSTGLQDDSKCKKWYYRIDGRYKYPQDTTLEKISHYYNQTLQTSSSYVDDKSFGLNNDIAVLCDNFNDQIVKNENNDYVLKDNNECLVYTLSEIAYVLYNGDETKQKKCNLNNPETDNRIRKLKEILLSNKIQKIKSITAAGYASAHGYIETNHKLGEHRAQTAVNWFLKNLKETINITPSVGYEPQNGENIGNMESSDKKQGDWVSGNESSINAKKWRYARVEIAFKSAASSTPADANDDVSDGNDEEEVITSGFYYKTNSSTPLPKETILNPPYHGVYDETYKVEKLEMTKVDDKYKFKLNGKEEKDVINYKEVTKSGDVCQIKDDKDYEIKKQISFSTINQDGDTEMSCVIYDYGDVICFAVNEKENYYKIGTDIKASALKHSFVDCKPFVLENNELKGIQGFAYNRAALMMNPNLKIKQYEYDGRETFSIVNNLGETKKYKVVSSVEESNGILHLNIDGGGTIYVNRNPIEIDKETKYAYIQVLSKVKDLDLIGTNCYYKMKSLKVGDETVLSISNKGVELVDLTNDTLKIRYKRLTDKDREKNVECIDTTYPEKVFNVISCFPFEKSYNIQIVDDKIVDIQILIENENEIKIRIGSDTYEGKGLKIVEKLQTSSKSREKVSLYATDEDASQTDGGTDASIPKVDEESNKRKVVDNRQRDYIGYRYAGYKKAYNGVMYDIYLDSNNKKWYKVTDPTSKVAKFVSVEYVAEEDKEPIERFGNGHGDENRLRYDQEYHFFKVLKQTDPVVYGNLMDKLQYFDPAFHSMTPEGFNGRLTFLQQCMRQGNTVSASDGKFSKSANNLAFGRAPYCVLRLGDFYNQMIVIDNLSISYDPLVWDLNIEGVGVQPLIANVQISFKFVGGGDLTGPVRRLQNAMSFNYYANARLYDNRADRIERMWSDKTNGAIEHDEILETSDKYNDAINAANEKDKKDLQQAQETMKKKEKVYNKDGKSSYFYTTNMYK